MKKYCIYSLFIAGAALALAAAGILGFGSPALGRPASVPLPPQFDPQNPPENAVVFFEDINFGGRWFAVYLDRDYNDLRSVYLGSNQSSGNWNDRISSLKIGKGACVTLWKDINYKGDKSALQGNLSSVNAISSLVSSGWNDKISSLKVRLRDNCAKS